MATSGLTGAPHRDRVVALAEAVIAIRPAGDASNATALYAESVAYVRTFTRHAESDQRATAMLRAHTDLASVVIAGGGELADAVKALLRGAKDQKSNGPQISPAGRADAPPSET